MSREYKAKVFFYDGLDFSTGKMISAEEAYLENYIEWVDNSIKPTDNCSIIVFWTGLKDKNNIDIYEGDILLGGQSKNGTVVFENGTFTVWGQPLGWDVETYSEQPEPSSTETWALVIGNIYENPELLNTKQ